MVPAAGCHVLPQLPPVAVTSYLSPSSVSCQAAGVSPELDASTSAALSSSESYHTVHSHAGTLEAAPDAPSLLRCSKCLQTQPYTAFSVNNTSATGRSTCFRASYLVRQAAASGLEPTANLTSRDQISTAFQAESPAAADGATHATCSQCQISKPRTAFHRNPANSSGLNNMCKPCKNIANWEVRHAYKRRAVEATGAADQTADTVAQYECNSCRAMKPRDQYYKDVHTNRGFARCKACVIQTTAATRQAKRAAQPKPAPPRTADGQPLYKCGRCQQWQTDSHYYTDKNTKSGFGNQCKACVKVRNDRAQSKVQRARIEAIAATATTEGWLVYQQPPPSVALPKLYVEDEVSHTVRVKVPLRDGTQHLVTVDREQWPTLRDQTLGVSRGRPYVLLEGRGTPLNRYIMHAAKDSMVVHENGDRLDCRKANLSVQSRGVQLQASAMVWRCDVYLNSRWHAKIFQYLAEDHPSYELARQQAIRCKEENDALRRIQPTSDDDDDYRMEDDDFVAVQSIP